MFDTGYGIAWFAGSLLMGILYSRSIDAVVVFSLAVQLVALPVFVIATRAE